jgi:hydrogenase nickel incorporation protein HypA/HybF
MHETGLVRDLIRRIEAAAAANEAGRVVGVRVWIGALSHLSAAHFREHFELESRGTPAEGARLTVTESTDPADPRAQHLMLESLEMEV